MKSWSRMFRIIKGCLLTFFGVCLLALFAVLRTVEYSQNYQQNYEDSIWRDHPKANNLITQMKLFPHGGDEISLTPQWEIPDILVHNDSHPFMVDDDAKYVVTNFSFSPGLGNIMFQYASLYGIAKQHGAQLIVPENILMRRAFKLSSTAVSLPVLRDMFDVWTPKIVFSDCCRYYNETETIEVNKTVFMGYFQSFKFFQPFARELRRELEFLPFVRQTAQTLIQNAIEGMAVKHVNRDHSQYRGMWQPKTEAPMKMLKDSSKIVNSRKDKKFRKDFSKYGAGNRTLIGVHIRRGMDITWNLRNMEHGHVIAPKRYIFNAMDYFRKRFDNPIFVVCSDNLYWCKKHLVADDVVFISSSAREIDLCVLSLCDHTIMSQGTFSWWAAYLAGGEAVYFKNWPRTGSKMDMMTVKDDYFLPHWVGMD